MPRNDKRVKITLECTECKRRNYITMKSKVNDRERLEMKKYCAHERRHTTHKETRVTSLAKYSKRCDSRSTHVDRGFEPRRVAGSVTSRPAEGSSSVGRASVSKTDGRGFESLLPCPRPYGSNQCHLMTSTESRSVR